MKDVGGYRLERLLGRGGTAQVYLAHSIAEPARRVALKVFHPGFWDQPELRRRALAEFRAVSALSHPNIAGVVEPVWDADPPAVALEYVEGASLEEYQARLPYVFPEAAAWLLREVLRALEHAHAQGVVHRDLKPANILIGDDGRVLVSDFGLAKMTDVSRHTLTGTLIGSPDFMSPEQARGETSTERSDLFSAAGILYFLVTGTRPFARSSPLATLAAVTTAEPEPAQRRNPKLSAGLAALIRRGLDKDPSGRFESAREFREALDATLSELGLQESEYTFASWSRSPSEVMFSAMKTAAESLARAADTALVARDWDALSAKLSHLARVAPESGAIDRLTEAMGAARSRDRRRRAAIPFAAAALAGISAVAWWSVWPAREAPPAVVDRVSVPAAAPVRIVTAARPTGTVRIDVPEGVRVFWDGRSIDPRRPLAKQKVGSHTIRLEMHGARPIVEEVVVKAEEPTTIRVR